MLNYMRLFVIVFIDNNLTGDLNGFRITRITLC